MTDKTNLRPETLEVVADMLTEHVLPPGSMTVEAATYVVRRYADAWKAQLTTLQAQVKALRHGSVFTNSPRQNMVTVQFASAEQLQEWLDARMGLAPLPAIGVGP